jgi:ribosomal peptide maturation radical SAM protein 1
MNITLVTMPWASLDCTSVAIGTLTRALERTARPSTVVEWYGTIEWAEWLLAVSDERITPADYEKFAGAAYFEGVGDWIFTSALYGTSAWREADYTKYLVEQGFDAELPVYMHHQASAFIDDQAEKIARTHPDLVGMTTTFLQNVASLALAARLRARLPDVPIVFGGGNCDGPQGEALLRNFDCVDYVVSGEGEDAIVKLVDHLNGDLPDRSRVPNLVYRDDEGVHRNSLATSGGMLSSTPMPRYDGYFHRLESSPVSEWVEPKLVIEGARGCWWGEKHQCTFCGLNGASIAFTSRPAHLLWKQTEELVTRHQTLDVIMVDNIIDMAYFKQLLPLMTTADYDLRVHYEIKSNIRPEHARALRDANVVHVQPGIESLSSRVLDIMKKGVTGVQNVLCLRECERYGLTVSWNYLYGFPGEMTADYEHVIAQLPAFEHLQPPGGVSRIALERFAPYFDDPSLGFTRRWPSDVYQYIYDLPSGELADLVYLFGCEDQGIAGQVETDLRRACDTWTRNYRQGALRQITEADQTVIIDSRPSWAARELRLTGLAHAVHATLDRGRTPESIVAAVGREHELRTDLASVTTVLDEFRQLGLVFEDDRRFVALATSPDEVREQDRLPA